MKIFRDIESLEKPYIPSGNLIEEVMVFDTNSLVGKAGLPIFKQDLSNHRLSYGNLLVNLKKLFPKSFDGIKRFVRGIVGFSLSDEEMNVAEKSGYSSNLIKKEKLKFLAYPNPLFSFDGKLKNVKYDDNGEVYYGKCNGHTKNKAARRLFYMNYLSDYFKISDSNKLIMEKTKEVMGKKIPSKEITFWKNYVINYLIEWHTDKGITNDCLVHFKSPKAKNHYTMEQFMKKIKPEDLELINYERWYDIGKEVVKLLNFHKEYMENKKEVSVKSHDEKISSNRKRKEEKIMEIMSENPDLTYPQIADKMGITERSVINILKGMGYKRQRGRRNGVKKCTVTTSNNKEIQPTLNNIKKEVTENSQICDTDSPNFDFLTTSNENVYLGKNNRLENKIYDEERDIILHLNKAEAYKKMEDVKDINEKINNRLKIAKKMGIDCTREEVAAAVEQLQEKKNYDKVVVHYYKKEGTFDFLLDWDGEKYIDTKGVEQRQLLCVYE